MKNYILISQKLWFQEGPGVRKNQYTVDGVKLINVANLVDGKVDLSTSDRYVSNETAYGKYKHFLVDEGDFVIASSGIKVDYFDKKMGIIEKRHLPLCMNTSTIRFKVLNERELSIKYFMYYLKSNHFKEQLTREITGSAQLNFGPSHLKKMVFPYVPRVVQDKIVDILDQIYKIEDALKSKAELLDKLVKSRFIKLFGDLSINPMKWPVMTFREFAKIDTQMIHNFSGYYEYPHIGIECIEKDTGVLSSYRTIKDDHVVSGKYWFTGKHIIYSKIRPNLNKVALPSFDGLCSADAYPILPKETVCSRYFLAYVMRSKFFLDYILAYSNRTNLPKVNKKQVEGFECPIPPLNLQKTFELIIRQVDKSKYYRFKFISLCRKIVNIEEEMLCQTLSF